LQRPCRSIAAAPPAPHPGVSLARAFDPHRATSLQICGFVEVWPRKPPRRTGFRSSLRL